jgi:phosphatidylglycerophosphatase A
VSKLASWIATWFGCGLVPKGPGTAGALGGLLVAWVAIRYANLTPAGLLIAAVVLTPVGMWAANVYARESGKKDPGAVVVDEVLGQWIALAAAPQWTWLQWFLAFVFFRLFDIWKPQPVRHFEKLPGGVGIVADDLMAGIYAGLVLRVLAWVYLV